MNWFCRQGLKRVYGRVRQETAINTFSILRILVQSDQGIEPSNSQSLKPSHLPNALLTLSTNCTSSLDTSSESTIVPDSIPKIDLNPTSVQPSLFYNASLGLRIPGASLSIIPSNLLPNLFPTLVSFNPSLSFKIQELGGAMFHIMFRILF